MPATGHIPWGYWEGSINVAKRHIELTQLRQAEFHANIAGVLAVKPLGLSYKIQDFDLFEGTVSVDVSLTHPYPNSNFRGFDTRGIFMGPGDTEILNNDPGLIYPAPDGCRVLNADGYTRWWNAQEFITSGLYGYDDSSVIPGFLVPATTLNPYKYFADCLGPDDPVVPNVDLSNRGTFSTDSIPPKLTRNYEIKFPKVGGQAQFMFHYAVDVSWAKPTGGSLSPKPIDDFPINANCPEAFHIQFDTEGTTAWYQSPTERGGDIELAVEVFDWQAASNPDGILGEIESIWIESPTLFDSFYAWPVTPEPGSQPTSGIFHFTIPNVTPTALENQEVLITVRSKSPNSYAPPVPGPKYPQSAYLSAYALVNIPVSDSELYDIHVLSPNGDELLMAGASSTIKWETSQYAEIEKVSILLSTNSGTEYDKPVALNAANTGSYIFYNIPETYIGCHNRIKIINADQPSLFDESDSDFTILPQLENQIIVTVPNGGEEWIAGTYEDIKWLGDPNIANVTIKLSQDMGETWPVTIVDSTPNTDGVFNWGLIPQEYVGTGCRIGIFDVNSPSIFDISDSNFSIMEPGIELDSPVGAEVWEYGNEDDIMWHASNIITNIDILLSLDSGGTYPITIADNTLNDGVFEWNTDSPGVVETTQARIKIQDHNNPALYFDESDNFTILEQGMTITYPNGGEEWRIGYPQTIEWLWTGNIPLVDIKMSLDGGMTFDNYIVQNEPNTGSFDIAIFDTAWLTDHTSWDFTGKEAMIRIESSTASTLNDESDDVFTIPITLGILNAKNCAASGDIDDDGVKNEVELMLAMVPDDFDSDHDGMYDFNELFHEASYNDYDLIPDDDCDGEFAPCDTDDDGDGVHDGELVDSDLDGVPNYLEYYGFTYNWLSGEFLKYDEVDVEEDYTVPYFKTDPMQPSTDQDPYGDGMEVSSLFMDQTVLKPGNSPMIPAMPNISVRLEGYDVTLNADIQDSEGGSEQQGKTWGNESNHSQGMSHQLNWEVGVEVTAKFGKDAGCDVAGHFNLGGQHAYSETWGSSTKFEKSEQTEVNWSTARSHNPSQAGVISLKLKAYNTGTACASNVLPTLTLSIAGHQVTTLNPNMHINILPPDGVYPAAEGVYWVIDTTAEGQPIFLTENELKAIETGAPVAINITQIAMDVAAMNEQGYWEYVGDWGEYLARVDAVCTHIYLDPGDGNALSYMVYSDNDPSSPTVTARDAFLWSGGYEGQDEFGADTILMPYRLPNGTWDEIDLMGCKWYVDQNTADQVPGNLVTPPPVDFNFMDIELTPNSYIIGKAPPQPPLDKPQIHWAVFDAEDEMLYASVSDYFRVEEVWVDGFNYGGDKDFMMEYDDTIGCYKAHVPGFLNEEGLDLMKATNVVGIDADPFPIDTIASFEVPPEPDSYPSIESSFLGMYEIETCLGVIVTADVNSGGIYDITGVYYLNDDDTYLCQLSGPPEGGHYTYQEEPKPFTLDDVGKILVINEGGFQAEAPISSGLLAGSNYIKNGMVWPAENGDWYLNLDANTSWHGSPRQETDDILIHVWGAPSSTYTELRLPLPGEVEWLLLQDFPAPSKDFIKSLTLAQAPTTISTGTGANEIWINDGLVFKTSEGRYGVIKGVDSGGGKMSYHLTTYSLWDGWGS